jgi:hypothetical protein
MPLGLTKLPCGVIYTDAFSGHMASVHAEQSEDHPRQVLTIEYVRCASGPLKDKAWWQIHWIPLDAAPDYRCFRIGGVLVHIPKSVQHGLRERCLDYKNGSVIVLP